MKHHDLKTIEPFYTDIVLKGKRLEIRIDDRDYQPEDTVILRQYDPEKQDFSGRKVKGVITYVLRGYPAIQEGYCAFSFETNDDLNKLEAVRDYLLEHGANDEKVNDKIRELKEARK
ncbi:DUF3850 domain-containing protein [Flavobacterium sp.]